MPPTNPANAQYKVDEKVLCFHGPMLYEAKILDTRVNEKREEVEYKVHYKGWKNTWDEFVPTDRLRKMTEDNLRIQQQLKQTTASIPPAPPLPPTARGRPAETRRKPAGPFPSTPSTHHPDDAFGSTPSTSTNSAHTTTTLPRGQKRPRDLDDHEKRELKLYTPEEFKAILVDDWENVTKNQQLVKLPRRPSVAEIIDGYRDGVLGITNPSNPITAAAAASGESGKDFVLASGRSGLSTAEQELLEEFVSGLRLYFHKCLGVMLLYRFERQQYADVLREYGANKDMGEIYGGEHLLRLFVSLPELITHTNMDTQAIAKLRQHLDGLARYMVVNRKRIFESRYESASPGYVEQTKGLDAGN